MDKEVQTWLEDIRQAIEEIETFLPEKLNFFEFQKDLKGRKAIERNIEIIGEAVNRILKIQPDIRIANARKIVDTRNRISHGYDSVSEDIIWTIVIKDLKNLKKEIIEFLPD
ncbi:MAG: DUF86 domain-containing protein [Salinivirgaceae bacterium]|nr:DUF86 domain-containing protein [Salinivirgaceae bacterium]